MKQLHTYRGRLVVGIASLVLGIAQSAAIAGPAVSSQSPSPFVRLTPQQQKAQQAEIARLVAKLDVIQIVSLLTPSQKSQLVSLLVGATTAERIALLTKYYPQFPKLTQQQQNSVLAQLATVVPLPVLAS